MEKDVILEIDRLDKHYGKVHAVDQLSFSVRRGNVYGLLGPNGSGKSTLLGMILNVVNPGSGTYRWFGGKIPPHQALKRIGAIIERPNFYPYMTAVQNLELVCKIKGVPYDRIDGILETVHLSGRKDSKFRTFSLGMKQRLAIASALLNEPEILILDEPTNGLDPQGINDIRNIITGIAERGTTILLASHLLDEVEKVCSHVIILRKGKKIYDGIVDGIAHTGNRIEVMVAEGSAPEDWSRILESLPGVEKYEISGRRIRIFPEEGLKASAVNRHLVENGLDVEFLHTVKPNLEQRFLAITNDSQGLL